MKRKIYKKNEYNDKILNQSEINNLKLSEVDSVIYTRVKIISTILFFLIPLINGLGLSTFVEVIFIYLFPKICLKVITLKRIRKKHKESLAMMNYTIMLLKTQLPVKEMIKNAKGMTKVHKQTFINALKQNDINEILEFINNKAETSKDEILIKVINAFRQALESDREIAHYYLVSERKMYLDNKVIRERKRNNLKNTFGIISNILALVGGGILVFSPWLIWATTYLEQVGGVIR